MSRECKDCAWNRDGNGGMACALCAGIKGHPEFCSKEDYRKVFGDKKGDK